MTECRYCYQSGGSDLRQVCSCREHVHVDCVRKYILHQGERTGAYPFRCPECRTDYPPVVLMPHGSQVTSSNLLISLGILTFVLAQVRVQTPLAVGISAATAAFYSLMAGHYPNSEIWDRTLISILMFCMTPPSIVLYSCVYGVASTLSFLHTLRTRRTNAPHVFYLVALVVECGLILASFVRYLQSDIRSFGLLATTFLNLQWLIFYPSM
jgi:hypothetical protein